MRIIKYLFLLVGAVCVLSSCSKFSKVMKSKDYEYKLRMADQYFVKKKYRFAQQLYEDLFPVFKGSNKFEDIHYKFAYCAYYLKDYISAENLFKSFLEYFPNSAKAEEVDFMHAFCFFKQSPKPALDQTNTIKAMGQMQTFINTHPGSERNKEAQEIIDQCYSKMIAKDYSSAELYYNLGQYKAAAISFTTLLNSYPDAPNADEFKLWVVKSYYKYAAMSIPDRQNERYGQVIEEAQDFQDRFPESKLLKEAERYLTLSQTNLKTISQ
ncbi:outer membrane protein assembly factor BamD [Agriterribacter sp.]|uniref:outer membrane protein assembly factor BamD n=1 Tax=Agriterribacter sp. TaxID=2821509 RepID=UPI002BAFD61F|nr:outer membrane protein assembly factor BamD [Agriterribacter sp.]HTN05422.1 outer membrane protein assembly factor BamD [Agriterribacter sp.]